MNPDGHDSKDNHEKKEKASGHKKKEKAAKGKRRPRSNHDTFEGCSSMASEPLDGASNVVFQDNNHASTSHASDRTPFFTTFDRAWHHHPTYTEDQDSSFTRGLGTSPPSRQRPSDDDSQGSGSRSLEYDVWRRSHDWHSHRHQPPTLRNRGTKLGQSHSSENTASSSSTAQDFSPPRRHRSGRSEKNSSPRDGAVSFPDLVSSQAEEARSQDVNLFPRDDRSPSLSPHFTDFYANILRGLGTESEPFEISPDPPSSSSSVVMSDEAMARQLQEEEWHSGGHVPAYPYFEHNSFSPMRRQSRAPARTFSDTGPFGLLDLGQHQRQASRNEARARASRASRRRTHMDHMSQMSMSFLTDDITSLIFELFHNYGMSNIDIESLLNPNLNPGAVGDPIRNDYESLLALAERLGEVSKGMSEEDIQQIPTSRHVCDPDGATADPGGEKPQCNICLSDYQDGDEMRNLPCKHNYHVVCVDQWLKINATCPICRAELKKRNS
ncbi:uncharacterized protein LOC106061735 isoform X1 [Biomphalaria glabrata]|uniref:RING-type E3 ubiquitin transferase n=1 Tax=Biomphalaria glabrata TaxID=6526 RepID=A0A9W3BDZ2_BIOGL|nr:uncharacterized protein LOC106061735 isoform X1 [Biomphalaria glabrata]XP_055897810.1 uncharacterized protein LOC106061735 isoform X1 [Biomphalaria glabrata]XP_055897811.1 uncharacterized protein LOC106061735 isoform X1 [Biomphalaria glabrata]XP_055897812.1 uncharacterized protein LOC106061735 isoform X1 [Biomphalaria glabrata]XP_055897813.1 uncharacterized protein LOC106061735 isoform X1 [Biomphalaria glabrata]KAI8741766.1 E3 ubiquitin-protein ligase RNF6 isoform X2 [Biomphalaria glabrata]